tara:strand:- start:177 stop:464 length:288 start_codon:yes stop_codon:yes gene_type:complete
MKISKAKLKQIIKEELDAHLGADNYPPYQSKSHYYRIRQWPEDPGGWHYVENYEPKADIWHTVYAHPKRHLAIDGAKKVDRGFDEERLDMEQWRV